MTKLKVLDTNLCDVKIIEPDVFGDKRGFFTESYNSDKLRTFGINHVFLQDNHSLSREAGVLRGLHYQLAPKAQTKLIRCTSGVLYDVLVDMRVGSPTYSKWEGYILSEYNHRQLLIPKGFAHGFCTLSENVNVQYKVDEYYSPEHDRGISFDDGELKIVWPMPMSSFILSDKDKKHPSFKDAENNFVWGEI